MPTPEVIPPSARAARAPRIRTLAALLVGAVLVVHGRTVGHDLLSWDDLANTLGNPHIHPPSLAGTLHFWRHAHMDLYVPVTYTLWALLARIAMEPWLFHGANVLLHAGAALAAFGLLRRLVRDDRASFLGACLFALHPVQVEAVAWMSGTKDLLAGLFGLLALSRYVAFAEVSRRGVEGGGSGRREYAVALLAFAVALLAKPAAVAVPLLAAILDLALVRRRLGRVARDLAPFLLLGVAWIFLTRAVQPAAGVAVPPLVERPLVAFDALAFYLGQLVFPHPLTFDYGRDPAWVLEQGRPWVSVAVVVALAAAIVAFARWRPGPFSRATLAGAGLFVAGVSPVLGLVPFDFQRYSTVSDHYLYLSMIGPALCLSALLAGRGGHATWLAAGAILAIGAAMSAVQAGVWRDDLTLYRHGILAQPRSWVAHDNLGAALAARGRIDEALTEYEAAIAINPRDARTRFNLGTALDELDRTGEALPHLLEAVRLEPRDRLSRENLAIVLLRLERPAEAMEHLRAALEIEAGSWLAHYYVGAALDRLGRLEEAALELEEAVRLNPRFGPARRDLEAVRGALK